jgi:hypothetical protein
LSGNIAYSFARADFKCIPVIAAARGKMVLYVASTLTATNRGAHAINIGRKTARITVLP